MWVYRNEQRGLFTVGYFYDHYYSGEERSIARWHPVEDFSTETEARELVHYLNGGNK